MWTCYTFNIFLHKISPSKGNSKSQWFSNIRFKIHVRIVIVFLMKLLIKTLVSLSLKIICHCHSLLKPITQNSSRPFSKFPVHLPRTSLVSLPGRNPCLYLHYPIFLFLSYMPSAKNPILKKFYLIPLPG